MIDLSISTTRQAEFATNPTHEMLLRSPRYRNQFFLRIQHTARSWGTDIESLLTGQIRSWITVETGIKPLIYRSSGLIGLSVSMIFVALALYGLFSVRNPSIEAFKAVGRRAFGGSTDDKLDFLINAVVQNPLTEYGGYVTATILVSVVAAIALGVVVGTLANNQPNSYLVLSEKRKKSSRLSSSRENLDVGIFCWIRHSLHDCRRLIAIYLCCHFLKWQVHDRSCPRLARGAHQRRQPHRCVRQAPTARQLLALRRCGYSRLAELQFSVGDLGPGITATATGPCLPRTTCTPSLRIAMSTLLEGPRMPHRPLDRGE